MLHALHASASPISGVSRHDVPPVHKLMVLLWGGVTGKRSQGCKIYLHEMFCVEHIASLYLSGMPSRKPVLYFFFSPPPTRQICLYEQSWKLNGNWANCHWLMLCFFNCAVLRLGAELRNCLPPQRGILAAEQRRQKEEGCCRCPRGGR